MYLNPDDLKKTYDILLKSPYALKFECLSHDTYSVYDLKQIISMYKDILNSSSLLELPPEQLDNILEEALLYLYNTLTVIYPLYIHGFNKLIDSVAFKNKDLSYKYPKDFGIAAEKLLPIVSYSPIICCDDNSSEIVYKNLVHIGRNQSIAEGSPLEEYIASHLIIRKTNSKTKDHTINPDFLLAIEEEKKQYKKPYKATKNEKYLILKDSRHFTAILLKLIQSKTKIPYTVETIDNLTLSSVNTLFNKLHQAVHDEEIISFEVIERLLLLYNSEYIFKPSLLSKVLDTFNMIFGANLPNVRVWGVRFLSLLPQVNSLSLNVIRLYAWNYIDKTAKDLLSGKKICFSTLENFLDICKELDQTVVNLVKLIPILFGSNPESSRQELLNMIYSFLHEKETIMKWSQLNEITAPKVNSLSKDYDNFYILCYFYSSHASNLSKAAQDLISPDNLYERHSNH